MSFQVTSEDSTGKVMSAMLAAASKGSEFPTPPSHSAAAPQFLGKGVIPTNSSYATSQSVLEQLAGGTPLSHTGLPPQHSVSPFLSASSGPYVSVGIMPGDVAAAYAAGLGAGSDLNNMNNVKRRGTDPTKFKTTICRNWEQTGTCTFRGCTFAHGVDDLRAPHRTPTSVPSAAVLPNSSMTNGRSPVVAAGPSPAQLFGVPDALSSGDVHVHSAMVANNGSYIDNLTMLPPPATVAFTGTSSVNHASVAGRPQTFAQATTSGSHSASNTPFATPCHRSQPGHPVPLALPVGSGRLETWLQALLTEVGRVRDLTAVHQEANKTLETMRLKEVAMRTEGQERLRQLKWHVGELEQTLQQKKELLAAKGIMWSPKNSNISLIGTGDRSDHNGGVIADHELIANLDNNISSSVNRMSLNSNDHHLISSVADGQHHANHNWNSFLSANPVNAISGGDVVAVDADRNLDEGRPASPGQEANLRNLLDALNLGSS